VAASDFNDLTGAYEALVNWPQRLAREIPFFRRWFQSIAAHTILDAACGTGHHAAAFHSEGLSVEAADLSPAMIARAQATFGDRPGLQWVVRSFEDAPAGTLFDAVICIGNSLSLCPNLGAVQRAVTAMMTATRPGGIVIIQVINLVRFPDGPCVWQKHVRATVENCDVLINKGIHRCGGRGFVDIVVSPLKDPTVTRHESIPLLQLELNTLREWLQQTAAQSVEAFGDYEERPFSPDDSSDLILVARK
jgi:SAM-dependent methyltransferase